MLRPGAENLLALLWKTTTEGWTDHREGDIRDLTFAGRGTSWTRERVRPDLLPSTRVPVTGVMLSQELRKIKLSVANRDGIA